MKKADIVLLMIFVIFTVGATVFQFNGQFKKNAEQAIIYSDGAIVKTLKFPLADADYTFTNAYGSNHVQVSQGKISIAEADCRDKLCEYSTPISRNGEIITCLPHKFYIEIQSTEESDLDALAM